MKRRILAAIVFAISLSGCANSPNQHADAGFGIGAVAGAVVGNQTGFNAGPVLGAIIGGAAGAAIGQQMDEQEAELRAALRGTGDGAVVSRLDAATIKVDARGDITFATDKAEIRPSFEGPLRRIAEILNNHGHTRILVVGHTDNRGSDRHNFELSLRRARSVAGFLAGSGISGERLQVLARGESAPKASNRTAAGRQANRRVEIYIKQRVDDA